MMYHWRELASLRTTTSMKLRDSVIDTLFTAIDVQSSATSFWPGCAELRQVEAENAAPAQATWPDCDGFETSESRQMRPSTKAWNHARWLQYLHVPGFTAILLRGKAVKDVDPRWPNKRDHYRTHNGDIAWNENHRLPQKLEVRDQNGRTIRPKCGKWLEYVFLKYGTGNFECEEFSDVGNPQD